MSGIPVEPTAALLERLLVDENIRPPTALTTRELLESLHSQGCEKATLLDAERETEYSCLNMLIPHEGTEVHFRISLRGSLPRFTILNDFSYSLGGLECSYTLLLDEDVLFLQGDRVSFNSIAAPVILDALGYTSVRVEETLNDPIVLVPPVPFSPPNSTRLVSYLYELEQEASSFYGDVLTMQLEYVDIPF